MFNYMSNVLRGLTVLKTRPWKHKLPHAARAKARARPPVRPPARPPERPPARTLNHEESFSLMHRSLPRLVTNAKLIEGCSVSMCSNDLNFAKSTPQCLELAKPKHATLCGRGCDVWYNVCCTGKCGSPERALTGKTFLLKMSCPSA